MKLSVLGSGSTGNAVLIVAGNTRVLVDAGLSAKEIARRLALVGEDAQRLDAVLVTHEHGLALVVLELGGGPLTGQIPLASVGLEHDPRPLLVDLVGAVTGGVPEDLGAVLEGPWLLAREEQVRRRRPPTNFGEGVHPLLEGLRVQVGPRSVDAEG